MKIIIVGSDSLMIVSCSYPTHVSISFKTVFLKKNKQVIYLVNIELTISKSFVPPPHTQIDDDFAPTESYKERKIQL